MQTFDVYFLGEMLPDADAVAVRSAVARLFKVDGDRVDRLFSGKPLRVKHAVDAEAASRYRATFREAGALLQIVPSGDPAPAGPVAADQGISAGRATQPSGTQGMQLAEPGATIDHTPAPPPTDIDTGTLEALPPNTGSLEDCREDKAPRPIPDISHLKLVED
jgi:hypothetical protein